MEGGPSYGDLALPTQFERSLADVLRAAARMVEYGDRRGGIALIKSLFTSPLPEGHELEAEVDALLREADEGFGDDEDAAVRARLGDVADKLAPL